MQWFSTFFYSKNPYCPQQYSRNCKTNYNPIINLKYLNCRIPEVLADFKACLKLVGPLEAPSKEALMDVKYLVCTSDSSIIQYVCFYIYFLSMMIVIFTLLFMFTFS